VTSGANLHTHARDERRSTAATRAAAGRRHRPVPGQGWRAVSGITQSRRGLAGKWSGW